MANSADMAQTASPGKSRSAWANPLAEIALDTAVLTLLFALLRVALLLQNRALLGDAGVADIAHAFLMGFRFDLRVACYGVLPLWFALILPAQPVRRFARAWLLGFASIGLFFGVLELPFYGEFQQRLNDLVFQYLREDAGTVFSMIWYGEPVVMYTLVWIAGTFVLWRTFRRIARQFAGPGPTRWPARILVGAGVLLLLVLAARGTLRSGPPLRWGDAYFSDVMFLNHLGLNGLFTLTESEVSYYTGRDASVWLRAMPQDEATLITRELVLTAKDTLVDADQAPVRRVMNPADAAERAYDNVVIILMESFHGLFVGALGNTRNVTPEFDRLAAQGTLFTHFFSNGTHTHQGMFATLACFPNLPGYEYLMQEPEGRHTFSGIAQLLDGENSLFVYNGDFRWDNQGGFFRKQGMQRFIGRYDFATPFFLDPVWGVSDQDMFDRAVTELDDLAKKGPFVAVLQTLSNHLPYAIPEPLEFEPVMEGGKMVERLTAMKYSDWALGRFFREIEGRAYYGRTLFVILGDHGFGVGNQLTEVNLLRFRIPLLLLGPGIRQTFGARIDRVGAQVDMIPTLLGLKGLPVQHQCWGRDLLHLPVDDPGFAIIKPSGGEYTVAMLRGDRIATYSIERGSQLYRYSLYPVPEVEPLAPGPEQKRFEAELRAYIQTAIRSLLDDTAGARIAGARIAGAR